MSDTVDLGVNVSRETLADLHRFAALVQRWNAKINLVGPSTLADFWQRHIVDSAQLFPHAPAKARLWADLGSGGGLPGVVCAVIAREHMPDCAFVFVESDKRKAAFLMTAVRELQLNARVIAARVEEIAPLAADVVSARALAALDQLLPLVARHLAEGGVALLPKGKSHEEELAAAEREWQFTSESHPSKTEPLARLMILKGLRRG